MAESLEGSDPEPQNTPCHLFMALSGDTYLAGRSVDGVVVAVVNTPLLIKSIYLIVRGLEYVSWTQGVTLAEQVEGTHWWLAQKLALFPEFGESQIENEVVVQPGTYTYPFCFTLPEDLPGSFENVEDRLVDFGISEDFKAHTLDNTCIRYSVQVCLDILRDQGDLQRLSQTRMFKVVEQFETKCLLEQASLRKGRAEYFFGGPITCLFWVANHGNILRGQMLHICVDIQNKSAYDVDYVLISVWEHKTFKVTREGEEPQSLSLSRVTQELIMRENEDVFCETGEQQHKVAKFQVKAPNPSIRHGKLITVKYEVTAEFVQVVDNIILKIPITIFGFCDQLRPDLPSPIPVNLHNDKALELFKKDKKADEEERKKKEEATSSSIFGNGSGGSFWNRLWGNSNGGTTTSTTTTTTTTGKAATTNTTTSNGTPLTSSTDGSWGVGERERRNGSSDLSLEGSEGTSS